MKSPRLILLTAALLAPAIFVSAASPRPVAPIAASEQEERAEALDDSADAESDEDGDEKKDSDKPKTIGELTKDSELLDGLFPIYRDRKTGELRLLLREEHLNTDFLYFSYVENGVAEAGWLTRGAYQVYDAKVFRIRRYYDRLEFVESNARYYMDPEKAIARSGQANISEAVLFDAKIEGEDSEACQLVIKADKLFLTESLQRISPLPPPDKKPHETFRLGKLSEGKSKTRKIRNYPENTDVIVDYVYENEQPYVSGSEAVTDPRFISISVQHSLIKAPEEPMAPRFDDPRVGYFLTKITDLSATHATPYRDVIKRWRLEKKYPDKTLSEPKKPIVYWIENTTPRSLRPIIQAAALRWNEAFEHAGFKDAIQVAIQPDDADWEAGDLRYNVIRWVSSPEPMYGGYGPNFSDPRTGEYLGGDIILEHVVITNQLRHASTLGSPALEAAEQSGAHPQQCSAALHAQAETVFAMNALDALGADSAEKQRLLEEFIYFLTLHEVGHTLGLSHNFRSSHLHGLEALYDPDTTYPIGLCSSVMDYPAVPFRPEGSPPGQYWTTRPGPYDHWAIAYGYTPSLEDEDEERARLAALLARSTEPALAYGNDADDMRAPGKAIDPRSMINDMSADPIGFAQDQIQLIKSIQSQLRSRLGKEGESYQELVNGYHLCLSRFRGSVEVVSRFIGGVQVDRAMRGQPGAGQPLEPVPLHEQQRAMATLRAELFAPEALESFATLAEHLLPQRRGWDHARGTEDPKLHSAALNIQKRVLDHLLHPAVLARLTDTRLYGNEYAIDQFLLELTDAVFEDDLNDDVNTFRQGLQLEYVDRLVGIVNGKDHDRIAQSMALNRLRWIEQALDRAPPAELATRAHREHIRYRIQRGLEPKA